MTACLTLDPAHFGTCRSNEVRLLAPSFAYRSPSAKHHLTLPQLCELLGSRP